MSYTLRRNGGLRCRDLTGKQFGRWTVLCRAENDRNGNVRWECRCECGTVSVVHGTHLRSGVSPSCGCQSRDRLTRHGGRKSRLYKIWEGMKQRCYNLKHEHYGDYGGRRIVVCDAWREDFTAFREWATGNGYDSHLTLDRKDNDGPYSPANCRFSTRTTQNNNKRTNRRVEYCGEQYTASQLARLAGIPYHVVINRLNSEWDTARIVETPVAPRRPRVHHVST